MKFNGSLIGVNNLNNEFGGFYDSENHYDKVLSNQWTTSFGVILQEWYENIPSVASGQHEASSFGPINIWFRRSVYKTIYQAGELGVPLSEGQVLGLRINVTNEPVYEPLPNYAIGLKNTLGGRDANPGATGFTVVYGPVNQSFSLGVNEFIFDTPFSWDGSNLAVAWAWGQVSPTYDQSGIVDIVNSGTSFGSRTDGTGTYTVNDSASQSNPYRPVIELLIGPN